MGDQADAKPQRANRRAATALRPLPLAGRAGVGVHTGSLCWDPHPRPLGANIARLDPARRRGDVRALAALFARRDIRLQIQLSNSHAPASDTPRHCEEPPGLAFEPDDRLRDEAIHFFPTVDCVAPPAMTDFAHSVCGSVCASIEGSGSPTILASKPRNL